MSTTPETETPETPESPRPCHAVGALVVDGVRKAWLRCALPAGHDEPLPCDCETGAEPDETMMHPATPHAVTLEWADDAAMRDDWPEAYDPAEPIDVDVPMLSDDELEAVARDARVDEAVDADREARAFDE